jgi:hypothetical protein
MSSIFKRGSEDEEYDSEFLVYPPSPRPYIHFTPKEYKEAILSYEIPPPGDHTFPEAKPRTYFMMAIACLKWREQLHKCVEAMLDGMRVHGDIRFHWSLLPEDTYVTGHLEQRLEDLGYTHVFCTLGEMLVSYKA